MSHSQSPESLLPCHLSILDIKLLHDIMSIQWLLCSMTQNLQSHPLMEILHIINQSLVDYLPSSCKLNKWSTSETCAFVCAWKWYLSQHSERSAKHSRLWWSPPLINLHVLTMFHQQLEKMWFLPLHPQISGSESSLHFNSRLRCWCWVTILIIIFQPPTDVMLRTPLIFLVYSGCFLGGEGTKYSVCHCFLENLC